MLFLVPRQVFLNEHYSVFSIDLLRSRSIEVFAQIQLETLSMIRIRLTGVQSPVWPVWPVWPAWYTCSTMNLPFKVPHDFTFIAVDYFAFCISLLNILLVAYLEIVTFCCILSFRNFGFVLEFIFYITNTDVSYALLIFSDLPPASKSGSAIISKHHRKCNWQNFYITDFSVETSQ